MTPDRKRRDLFLALIDALLEHVQMNTRMDIRDRIAALALVDRVLAQKFLGLHREEIAVEHARWLDELLGQ